MPRSATDRLILAGAAAFGPSWLRSRRNAYRPRAEPLREHERAALAPFFAPATLDAARVARVEQFDRWPAERLLGRLGLRGLLGSQTIAGIALIDTVVIVTPTMAQRRLAPLSLLFHELVHIEQFRALGVRGFVREYIGGWLDAGRSYIDIPLEDQAYRLTDRYEADPSSAFSVADAIAPGRSH